MVLVLYFSFDDGTARDISGYGNNGTINNAKVTAGLRGRALAFNGVDSYVVVNTPNQASVLLNDMTISLLVRPDHISGTQTLIECGGTGETPSTNIRYSLKIMPNGELWVGHEFSNGQDQFFTVKQQLFDAGKWTHLVVVRKNNEKMYHIYVNGKHITHVPYTNSPDGGEGARIVLGKNVNDRHFLAGILDEVRVYDNALTEQQIVDLFNSYQTGEIQPPPTQTPTFPAIDMDMVLLALGVIAVAGIVYYAFLKR